jgi:hypothetical protein
LPSVAELVDRAQSLTVAVAAGLITTQTTVRVELEPLARVMVAVPVASILAALPLLGLGVVVRAVQAVSAFRVLAELVGLASCFQFPVSRSITPVAVAVALRISVPTGSHQVPVALVVGLTAD